MKSEKVVYKVIFHNQGNIYELYAREVSQSNLLAFVEVADILFGEKSQLLVDPGEEKLKAEFAGVKRTYIPLQAVVRIDEVEQAGVNKIVAEHSTSGKITQFPYPPVPSGNKPEGNK